MDDEAVEVPAAVDGAAHDEEADEGPDDRFVVQGAMEGPFRDDPVVANGPAARLACMSVLLTFAGLYVNELSHEQLIEHNIMMQKLFLTHFRVLDCTGWCDQGNILKIITSFLRAPTGCRARKHGQSVPQRDGHDSVEFCEHQHHECS